MFYLFPKTALSITHTMSVEQSIQEKQKLEAQKPQQNKPQVSDTEKVEDQSEVLEPQEEEHEDHPSIQTDEECRALLESLRKVVKEEDYKLIDALISATKAVENDRVYVEFNDMIGLNKLVGKYIQQGQNILDISEYFTHKLDFAGELELDDDVSEDTLQNIKSAMNISGLGSMLGEMTNKDAVSSMGTLLLMGKHTEEDESDDEEGEDNNEHEKVGE